jgi:hypothetical protein
MSSRKIVDTSTGICRIHLSGFKAIRKLLSLDVAPLTVLSGANSSGKSSVTQAILLMKQTLEAAYDPGPLLLHAANVQVRRAETLFSLLGRGKRTRVFRAGITVRDETWDESSILSSFTRTDTGVNLSKTLYTGIGSHADDEMTLDADMEQNAIRAALPKPWRGMRAERNPQDYDFKPVRNRCFWELRFLSKLSEKDDSDLNWQSAPQVVSAGQYISAIQQIIHLPGLRGFPSRSYPITAVGSTFPGTFDTYAASIIHHWTSTGNDAKLQAIGLDLASLGLSWKVRTVRLDDTQVELRVGRLIRAQPGGAHDLVNIADVGLGVSQILPVIVALHAAESGQLVILEQPEIHLHPHAQKQVAELLVHAANRGVKVIVETHSGIILRTIQAMLAEDQIRAQDINLHWFQRDSITGLTSVYTAELDEFGAFGEWPEDFGAVALEADERFLNARDSKLISQMEHREEE